MTGLIFCDRRHDLPQGLPARTPPVVRRFYQAGYLVVEAKTGGLYVVAHWYVENGALRHFTKCINYRGMGCRATRF